MEANKNLGNMHLLPLLQGPQQPYKVSKKGHLPVGAETLRYFGDLEKGGIQSNLWVFQSLVVGSFLGISGLERPFKL